jgi:hypothetical protein
MKTRAERLQHIRSHIERFRSTSNAQANLEKGGGNISACLLSLAGNATAEAMINWFEKQNMAATRGWFYLAALLEHKRNLRGDQPIQPLPSAFGLLKPLISNNESLIQSFVGFYETAFDAERINDVNSREFLAYQILLAIRGDWDKLMNRARSFVSNPPKGEFGRVYSIDYEIFLALSEGNAKKMEASIKQLLSPEFVKKRYEDEGGFTQDLIVTSAVVYAKIASRHGYTLTIDSPYFPKEWMENEPLAEYDPVYSFLK